MDSQKTYEEGEHVRIDGDGTEYEVTAFLSDGSLTLRPKYLVDEEQPERVTAPTDTGEEQSDVGE